MECVFINMTKELRKLQTNKNNKNVNDQITRIVFPAVKHIPMHVHQFLKIIFREFKHCQHAHSLKTGYHL